MTRRYLAWAVGALLVPLAGAGTALADGTEQLIGQSNTSAQHADADATSEQVGATNRNISVRVLSPGDDGDVTQSNSSQADAGASNANTTGQTATQQAAGDAEQAIGQANGNTQHADADATSKQIKPSNDNIAVRVLSPGDAGDVEQSNSSQAGATAGNSNTTGQSAQQVADAGDCRCKGGDVLQVIGQANESQQHAESDATSKQVEPSNSNIAVRVLSPGDDGDVEQSNSSKAESGASNRNATEQSARQGAAGGDAAQVIGQANKNGQHADSDATSEQIKPANDNIAVRVLSPGSGGDVDQSNSSKAKSHAGNVNATKQDAAQVAAPGDCRCKGGDVVQAIGQSNHSWQKAESDATSEQVKPSNSNVPVRVLSRGGDGDVDQSNSSKATSGASNANATDQKAAQQAGGFAAPLERELVPCGCKDRVVIQAIGQANKNGQHADADATSKQYGAENENLPVRVLSHGGGGSVDQSNSSAADAQAGNRNATGQQATQRAGGSLCGCRHDDLVIQAIGQENGNRQSADADATSEQKWPSNENAPLSIGKAGKGHGGHPMPAMAELLERLVRPAGSVEQANDSKAGSKAGSENTTRQGASQDA